MTRTTSRLVQAITAVALGVTLTLGSAPSARADATGGWQGSPVEVQISVFGEGRHVKRVEVLENWRPKDRGSRFGHTQVYNSATGTVINTRDHSVTNSAGHTQRYGFDVGRDFPDGSRMCARWWTKTARGYVGSYSSCIWIEA